MMAVSARPQQVTLPLADGVIVEESGTDRQAKVQVFQNELTEGKRLLVAGCDPWRFTFGATPGAISMTLKIVLAPSSSQQALEWAAKQGAVHIAGSHLR